MAAKPDAELIMFGKRWTALDPPPLRHHRGTSISRPIGANGLQDGDPNSPQRVSLG